MAIFHGPLSKHLFVCALLNFLLCSITYGTFRAAADPTQVQHECGPLYPAVMAIIFLRLFSIPCIVLMCMFFKGVTAFALVIDIYIVTLLLCIEVMVSSMQLTQFRCYETLKTDPTRGTAVFVYAMTLLITLDTLRLIHFAASKPNTSIPIITDEEIELLLAEPDEETPTNNKAQTTTPTTTTTPRT